MSAGIYPGLAQQIERLRVKETIQIRFLVLMIFLSLLVFNYSTLDKILWSWRQMRLIFWKKFSFETTKNWTTRKPVEATIKHRKIRDGVGLYIRVGVGKIYLIDDTMHQNVYLSRFKGNLSLCIRKLSLCNNFYFK